MLLILVFLTGANGVFGDEAHPVDAAVTHHTAGSGDHKVHYVKAGEGPMVLFIHGFPDFWYTWRYQMVALKKNYKVVAMDTRGYNLSGKPLNQKDYSLKLLVKDVSAVIESEKEKSAVIVGHDWGGMIAWNFAMNHPEMTDKLIIVNLPHPKGLLRELVNNPEQFANAEYARNFQRPDSHKFLSAEGLAQFVGRDPASKRRYQEAFSRSSLEGMMFYYRENYPKPPYARALDGVQYPDVTVPVLQFHGLKDSALHRNGLNGTWDWVKADYSLITLPDAGHWSHIDNHQLVSNSIRAWLKTQADKQ